MQSMNFSLKLARLICFNCPIQKQCLEIGMEYEEWGTWGGLTFWERDQIRNGKTDVRKLEALKKDLKELNITPEEALGGWHERISHP